MRSAWICNRNDVLGKTALGVFGTGTGWPDIMVAAIMATLALQRFRDRCAASTGRIAAREGCYRLGYPSSRMRAKERVWGVGA
jgi:hypothetical protein